MEEIVLVAEYRDVIGKQVKALRRQGKLPAVIYGRNIKPISVIMDTRETGRILSGVTSSHLIGIQVGKEKHTVLVREKQRHPVTGAIIHVDFLAVTMTEKLRANVVLELTGDAPAVKDFDGVVVTGVEQIEVESLPADLPERILVDISNLSNIGDSIHVRDLQISSGVQVLTDADELILLITAPAVEAAEEEAEEAEVQPEVIERGRKEEGEI